MVIMVYEIKLKDRIITYELQYKNVKNINLRINSSGNIYVSASKRVAKEDIEKFIVSKAELIFKAQEKFANYRKKPLYEYYTPAEFPGVIHNLCLEIYPYFEKYKIKFPIIKFRKMVSQWGNCYPEKGFVTFNTNLRFSPPECVKYVVAHEFVHFLHPDHSARFYEELSKLIPDWKECRRKLKEIQIR